MNQIPDNAPSWLVLAFFIIIVAYQAGKFLSETSDFFVKVFGPVGRYWRRAGKRREEARAAARGEDRAEFEDMAHRIKYLQKRLVEVNSILEEQDNYILYDTKWHRDLRLQAAESDCDLPEHVSWKSWNR
ncbi:membrane protein [Gordonia phage Ronaldo]|uniref:Minor tail protein n=4 Tax=Ronaldovirus TaxID=2733205 RepID=A0A6B9L8B5_9CAUD|nr:membrane protein [Gordonia phage Fryberger]YP_009807762.1 membrane protein [Gordonia phage Ronaldo]QDH48405.1 hypothetical protein SEA_ZIKO_66 [Gordonia phage Ziko]QHB38182.1 hypothetical protein SEA_VOLT_66 [Gordonia phage Volt]QTF81854.1 membrane protein [Gordonia phage Guey18]AXN53481.1 hypothetical protein SEA_FRYBERGER_63 [Gordonia phage Fryberger]AXN53628.1 hypothetical protein SEA_RONALDO_66 [Gordonia phage Ronaldo]